MCSTSILGGGGNRSSTIFYGTVFKKRKGKGEEAPTSEEINRKVWAAVASEEGRRKDQRQKYLFITVCWLL